MQTEPHIDKELLCKRMNDAGFLHDLRGSQRDGSLARVTTQGNGLFSALLARIYSDERSIVRCYMNHSRPDTVQEILDSHLKLFLAAGTLNESAALKMAKQYRAVQLQFIATLPESRSTLETIFQECNVPKEVDNRKKRLYVGNDYQIDYFNRPKD